MSFGFYAITIGGFGMASFLALSVLPELIKRPDEPELWMMLTLGPAFFALFALAQVRIAKWFWSGDERWIFTAIDSALREAKPTGGAASR